MKKIYTLFTVLVFLNALPQSGTLDVTFGTDGKVHTGFGTNNSAAHAVAVQPDGKIIVGGSAYTANAAKTWEIDSDNATLVRYLTNGTIDTSFGNDGTVMTDFHAFYGNGNWSSVVLSIKLQSDGKILTYGYKSQLGTGSSTVLVRYNADGSLDSSFGSNGHLDCNSSAVYGSNAVVIQEDGKIVALGYQYSNPSPNVYTTQFVLERFNPDGSIDSAFATNGKAITAFGTGFDSPNAIALQPDGKIIAAGKSYNNRIAIARYTTAGILDTSFDSDGKVTTSLQGMANFVTIDANGKILVAETTNGGVDQNVKFTLLRYNENGSLDSGFDTDGIATNANNLYSEPGSSYNVNAVSEQTDGKFLITTTTNSESNPSDFTILRYNADATTDSTFGIDGEVTTTVQPGYNVARSLALQPDDKIVVVGYSHPLASLQNEFNVLRYESDGSLDASFDTDGMASASFDSTNDEAAILLLQPDNKLVAVGTKRHFQLNGSYFIDIAISRYNDDGGLDASFGTSGKVTSVFGAHLNKLTAAVLQTDGKIIVANTFNTQFSNVFSHELIRYENNGSLDLGFGTNGIVSLDAQPHTLLSQPDGKIVVTYATYDSQNNPSLGIKRFNNDGIPDTTFGTNGTVAVTGIFYGFSTAAIQPDGKIVIAATSPGTNENGISVLRFNTDGSLDNTFTSTLTIADTIWYANAIFFKPDGKIIVAGRSNGLFGGYNYYTFVAACYNSGGSLDTTYGTNGVVSTYLGGTFQTYNIIQSVVLQADGKFLVALGKFEDQPTPNFSTYDFVIYRYTADGNLDSDFGIDGQLTTAFYNKYDEAFSMVLQPDNKIVVAGTTDTGINRDFAIARYKNTIALGVKDFIADTDLVLYPNPAKDILYIKAQVNGLEIVNYSIYNMLGQVIYKNAGGNSNVHIADFTRGIYNIQINTNKGMVSKKFIKE